MAAPSRYDAPDEEKDFILKNKLGISKKDLSEAEDLLLKDTYQYFLHLAKRKRLTLDSALLIQIHKKFLDTLYSWAGKLRTVEISKDGFLFAASRFISDLLKSFDQWLRNNLPAPHDSKHELARKLAFIHNELIAIHPFREGNGRTIRLFIDLIADQCGFSPITYPKSKKTYFAACRAGMRGDQNPMEKIMLEGLKRV